MFSQISSRTFSQLSCNTIRAWGNVCSSGCISASGPCTGMAGNAFLATRLPKNTQNSWVENTRLCWMGPQETWSSARFSGWQSCPQQGSWNYMTFNPTIFPTQAHSMILRWKHSISKENCHSFLSRAPSSMTELDCHMDIQDVRMHLFQLASGHNQAPKHAALESYQLYLGFGLDLL